MPTPRLTNIAVRSRRPIPATTGNFCAATAPTPGKHHLAAMRVPRQDKRNVEGGGLGEASGIVRQQDDRAFGTANDVGDIGGASVQ